jgi:hypothetical protein
VRHRSTGSDPDHFVVTGVVDVELQQHAAAPLARRTNDPQLTRPQPKPWPSIAESSELSELGVETPLVVGVAQAATHSDAVAKATLAAAWQVGCGRRVVPGRGAIFETTIVVLGTCGAW